MIEDYKNLLTTERLRLSEFSMEQDKTFNRYIVIGSAASVTLLINLLGNNPDIFENTEYMKWALWSFGFSIVMSAICLFLNARLSDFVQQKYSGLLGFLVAAQQNENQKRLDDETYAKFNKLSNRRVTFVKWARRMVMGLELSAGFGFCIGIGISMYEIGKLL